MAFTAILVVGRKKSVVELGLETHPFVSEIYIYIYMLDHVGRSDQLVNHQLLGSSNSSKALAR